MPGGAPAGAAGDARDVFVAAGSAVVSGPISATIGGSIFSASTDGCVGSIVDAGANVTNGASCPGTVGATLLGPVADNGGPTGPVGAPMPAPAPLVPVSGVTRAVTRRTVRQALKAGSRRIVIAARAKRGSLIAGRYRVTVTPAQGGRTGTPVVRTLTVRR